MSDLHPISRRVRTQAAATPGEIAVRGVERRLTYRELVDEVDAVAALLRAAGVAAGHTCALLARRDDRLPALLLALWQTGAVAALLDAAWPAARIAACESVVAPSWRIELGATVTIERRGPAGVRAGSHVLFTSGTTGRPAAVLVGAQALAGTLDWYAAEFRPAAGDRVAMLGGLGHDPLLRDVLVPLVSGAMACWCPPTTGR